MGCLQTKEQQSTLLFISCRRFEECAPSDYMPFGEDRFYLSVHPVAMTYRERWIIYASSALNAESSRAHRRTDGGGASPSGTCGSIFRHGYAFSSFLASLRATPLRRLPPSLTFPGPSTPQLNIGIDFHGSDGHAHRPPLTATVPNGVTSRSKVAVHVFRRVRRSTR